MSRSQSCGELRTEGRKSSKKTETSQACPGGRADEPFYLCESCEGTDDVSAVDGLVPGDPSVEC